MTLVFSRYLVTAGQSYGREGYNNGYAYGPFFEAIRRAISTNSSDLQTHLGGSPAIAAGQVFQLANGCYDGSAVLQKHTGAAGNYWLENDGETAGPRLDDHLAVLAAQTLSRSVVVYSHGEQDAGYTSTTVLADEVAAGMTELLLAIRTVLNPVGPNALPVFWDILGPRYSTHEMNEYRLRDAMLTEIDGLSRNFRGAEKYALRLDGTTHPSEDNDGYGRMGAWTGRKVAKWLIDLGELRGPQIGTVTRSGSSVSVPIVTPSGGTLIRPSEPDFFGLFDASDNRIPITSYSWSGDTLTITGATEPARFRYPARKGGAADIEKIVRLANPSDPIFEGEPGLPLESAQTVAL